MLNNLNLRTSAVFLEVAYIMVLFIVMQKIEITEIKSTGLTKMYLHVFTPCCGLNLVQFLQDCPSWYACQCDKAYIGDFQPSWIIIFDNS